MENASRTRLIRERRFLEAAELQAAELELRPEDAELHHHMAWLLGALKRFGEAAASGRTALALNPEEPRYATALAKYLDRNGDSEGARRANARSESLEAARREAFDQQQLATRR